MRRNGAQKAGDGQADFEALVRGHYARAAAFCGRMLRDTGEGEEVAQQVFVRLFEKDEDLSDIADLEPYLYRVLRNACIDHMRKRNRREHRGEPDCAPPAAVDLSRAEREEIHAAIEQAVGTLEDGQREVIVLRYFEGLSLVDVARVTDSQVGAVAMKLARAKAKLKEILGRLPDFRD